MNDSIIHFKCSQCSMQHQVPKRLAGRDIRCPGCGGHMIVPQASEHPASEPSAPEPTADIPAADTPPVDKKRPQPREAALHNPLPSEPQSQPALHAPPTPPGLSSASAPPTMIDDDDLVPLPPPILSPSRAHTSPNMATGDITTNFAGEDANRHPETPTPADSETYSDDEEEKINFSHQDIEDTEDLDMTPMVDVTFLLLIFFMVTATFAMQKSLEVPPPDKEENAQARTIQEIEQDDDFIIVRITKEDAFWVNDREAMSRQDLMEKIRQTRHEMSVNGPAPRSLLVLADSDCRHESVVMAIDAGNAIGIDNIRLANCDEENF